VRIVAHPSLLRPLLPLSSPPSLSLSLPLAFAGLTRIGDRSLRSSLSDSSLSSSLSLLPLPSARHRRAYNDSSWWDDTGSEVSTAEPDVRSMESSSSTGATALRWLHVLARSRARKIRSSRLGAFARTRVTREQLASKICVVSVVLASCSSTRVRGRSSAQ